MYLELPFDEAVRLATLREPLPPMVRSVRAEGSTVLAEVDLRLVPDPPFALRMAAAALGTISVSATVEGFEAGTALVAITFHARNIPAHTVMNHAVGFINGMLRERGLPEGLVEVRRGGEGPLVAVAVQDAVDTAVSGVTVTGLDLHQGTIRLMAAVGPVRLLR